MAKAKRKDDRDGGAEGRTNSAVDVIDGEVVDNRLIPRWIKIGTPVIDPNNTNVHDRRNIDAIKASLKSFGMRTPIVWNEKSFIVQKGNGTLTAVRELSDEFKASPGDAESWNATLRTMIERGVVPVLDSPLTERDARLYSIADNQTGRLSQFDETKLTLEFRELESLGADLALTGFDVKEIQSLIDSPESKTIAREDDGFDADDLPSRVNVGDLWALGNHRLVCGDSFDDQATSLLMEEVYPKLGLHDPPYGINISRTIGDGVQWGNAATKRNKFDKLRNDDRPFDPSKVLTSSEVVVIWGANHFADKLPASAAWICWDKRVDMASNDFSDCELAWINVGNRAIMIRHRWNGMIRDSERGESRLVMTQKPVVVIAQVVEMFTTENDAVADWFAGSGTTLVACEQLNRRCYAMEIEPKICDKIVHRWELFTGKTATRLIAGEVETE